MQLTAILAAAWLAAAPAPAGTVELGDLPSGAVSESRMHKADEVITYVLFDPARFRDRLPAGTDFLTLEQMAASDADIAAHLQAYPEHAGWAWSYFEIIGVGSLRYDGVRARPGAGSGMAVWYPALRRLDRSDARPQGHNMLALGAWVSDRRLAAHMRARGYAVGYGRVRFTYGPARLEAALDAPGLSVRAGCRLSGPLTVPDWAEAPQTYQTAWTPAGGAMTFEVMSWGGHRTRDCLAPHWSVSGSHPLAAAFAARPLGGPMVSGTEAAFGYELKGALYRR